MRKGETARRRRHVVALLAIRRGDSTVTNPSAEYRFMAGDVMVVLGKPEEIRRVAKRLQAADAPLADEST